MPFDKISPRMLFTMRILTGLTLLVMGGALVTLGASYALEPSQVTTRFASPTDGMFLFAAVVFGALLANAGLMLLELVTRPPRKMAINVPFVAANFQISLVFGLIALGLAIKHATLPGDASGGVLAIQGLCIAGFALNLMFVVMTKMHWNFTENTGKALPKG